MITWLKTYWWIWSMLLFASVMMNVWIGLKRINHKKFLENKPELPAHRDLNVQWDDEDDWLKRR